VGLLAGWALISPFYWFLFPSGTISADDRQIAAAVRDLDPEFVSVPGALSYSLIDRPLIALFPRPFRCEEESIGPYTAPDRPPDVIIMPDNALELLDEKTSSRLASLLRSYEPVVTSESYEAWQMVDVDRAAIDYVPCSSSTFTPSV
jgi:hypothetical protein